MKFPTAPAVSSAGAGTSICVHALARYQPLWGYGVLIKVYDDDIFVCEAYVSEKGANSDTHCITDCPNGTYHVELWNNGMGRRIIHKISGKCSLWVTRRDMSS